MASEEKFNNCKLCLKKYENTKVSRRNLSKNKNILSRLENIGLEFETIQPVETICLKCYRQINLIKEKFALRESWIRNSRSKRRKLEHVVFQVNIHDFKENYHHFFIRTKY